MKIKKQPGKKVPPSPTEVTTFIDECLEGDNDERLASLLEPCLAQWPFPKSDLFHWTRLLDTFDERLARDIEECWDSTTHLQKQPFPTIQRRLVLALLEFTRILLENCTSRNIYCSYDRLKRLLVTDDLEVVEKTLELLLIPARKLDSQSSLRATFEREIGTDEVAILGQLSLPFIPEMGELEAAKFALRFRDHHIHRLEEPALCFTSYTLDRLEYVKMLATAIFLMAQPEGTIDSAFFATSPTLVADTAKLISPTVQGEAKMEIAALSILRSCMKSGSRCVEIVNALNLPASHGPVASIFRSLVDAIVTGTREMPFHSMFIYAFLDFISILTTQVEMDDTFVNSGVVAETVRSVEALETMARTEQVSRFYKIMEKMLYILDALIHHYSSAIDFFFANNGLNIIVHQIVHFIQEIATREESVPHANSVMLQCLLRFIDKLLTTNGADDRLRNLLEGPFFRSLHPIFANTHGQFSPEQIAYAISSVAAFIHNEPTSLSALQEMDVPQALCRCIARKIPPLAECIARIPSAFSAICLNNAGAEYFSSINPVPNLCSLFLQPEYLKLLRSRGTASSLGTSMDEFIRHHPQFKTSVISDLIAVIRSVPAEMIKLRADQANADYFVGCDLATESEAINQIRAEGEKRVEPALSLIVEALSAFIEGIIQSPNHAKEFISQEGVPSLMELFYSTGISYDFTVYNESLSLSHMVRILSDIDGKEVISAVFNGLQRHSAVMDPFLNTSSLASDNSQFSSILAEPTGPTRKDLNEFYHGLCSSLALLGLLKDLYIAQSSYGMTRVNNRFVDQFETKDEGQENKPFEFILLLLRKSIWELGLLYSLISAEDIAGILLRAKSEFKASVYVYFANAISEFAPPGKSVLNASEEVLKSSSQNTSKGRCRNFLQLSFVLQRIIASISAILHAISYKLTDDALSSGGLYDSGGGAHTPDALSLGIAKSTLEIFQWLKKDLPFGFRCFLMTILMRFLPQITFNEHLTNTPASRELAFGMLESNVNALRETQSFQALAEAVEAFMDYCVPLMPSMNERDFELFKSTIKEILNYYVILSSPKMQLMKEHSSGRVKLRLLAFRFCLGFSGLPLELRSKMGIAIISDVVLCLANMVKFQENDIPYFIDKIADEKDKQVVELDMVDYFKTVAVEYLSITADVIPEVALMVRNLCRERIPINRPSFDEEDFYPRDTEDHHRANSAQNTKKTVEKVFGWLMSRDCPLSVGIRLRLLACSLGVSPLAKRYIYAQLIESIPSIVEAINQVNEDSTIASGLLLLAEIVYYTTLPIRKPFGIDDQVSNLYTGQIQPNTLERLTNQAQQVICGSNDIHLDIVLSALFLLTALTRKSEAHQWIKVEELIPALVRRAVQCIHSEDRRYRSLAILSVLTITHLVETPEYLSLIIECELLAANPASFSSRSRIKSFITANNMDIVMCRNYELFRDALVKHFVIAWSDPEWEDSLEECMVTSKKASSDLATASNVLQAPTLADLTNSTYSPNAEKIMKCMLEELQKFTVGPPQESPQANEKGEEDPVVVQQHFSRCFLIIAIAELVHSYPICRHYLIQSKLVTPLLRFALDYMTPCGELAGTLGSRMFVNESMWVSQLLDEICSGPLQVPPSERIQSIPESCNLVVDALCGTLSAFIDNLGPGMVVDYAAISKAWCLVMTAFVLLSTKAGGNSSISFRLLSPSQSAIVMRMVEKGIMSLLASLLRKLDRSAPMAPIVAAKIIFSMEMVARMCNRLAKANTSGRANNVAVDEFSMMGRGFTIEEEDDDDEDDLDDEGMDIDEEMDEDTTEEDLTDDEGEDDEDRMMNMEIELTEDESSDLDSATDDDDDLTDMEEDDEDEDDDDEDVVVGTETEEMDDDEDEEIRLIIEPPVGASGPAANALASGYQVIPYDVRIRGDGAGNGGARAWTTNGVEIRTDEEFHEGEDMPFEWTEESAEDAGEDDDGEEEDDDDDEDEDEGGMEEFEMSGPTDEIFTTTGHGGGEGRGDGLMVTLQPRFGGVGVGIGRRRSRFSDGMAMEGVRFTSRGMATYSSQVREQEVYPHPLVSPRIEQTSTFLNVGRGGRGLPFIERLPERPSPATATLAASTSRPRYENQEIFHAPAIVNTIRRWTNESRLFLGKDISTMVLEAAPEIVFKPLFDEKAQERRAKELVEKQKQQELQGSGNGRTSTSSAEEAASISAATSMSGESTVRDQAPPTSAANAPSGEPAIYEDMGPDREFLEALPFEMRREVLDQYFEERRRNIPDAAEVRINADFLASLPADLRADYERLSAQEVERYRRRGHGRSWGDVDFSTLLQSMGPEVQRAIVEAFEAEIMEGGHTPGTSGLIQPSRRTARPPGAPPTEQIANLINALGQSVRRARETGAMESTTTTSGVSGAIPQATTTTAPRLETISAPSNEVAGPSALSTPIALPKIELSNIIDISSLAVILKTFFDPLMTEHRVHIKLFLHLSAGASNRADLLNMLIYILEETPEDLNQLESVLDTYCAVRTNINKPGTPKPTPAKRKHNAAIKQPGSDPFGGSSYVVIQQRTAQLLMQLVQHSEEVRTFFTSPFESTWTIKRTDKKVSGKVSTITTHYPLVLLLACFEKHRFVQIPLLVENLLHLLQLVTGNIKESNHSNQETSSQRNLSQGESTKLEIPQPFISSMVKTIVNAEMTSKAFQYATQALQNLCSISGVASMLIRELAELSISLVNHTNNEMKEINQVLCTRERTRVNEALKVVSSPIANQARLLRCMKLLSSCILKPLRAENERAQVFDALQNEDKFDIAAVRTTCANDCWMELFGSLDLCLRSIGDDGELLHVASGLLPAIESQFWHFRQMVVVLPEYRQNEETFLFAFAERHRVLLNSMIRASPNLLTVGAFILLTKLPRTLDFDNKRSWFRQQLVKKGVSRPSLSIHVRRAHVFEDSFHAIMSRSGDEVKYGRLSIKFHDEEGLDAGGVTREWFAVLSRQMFDPNYALFKVSTVDKITYQPNRMSFVNPDHLHYFTFVGRIIGKAIYDNRLLDCYFTRSFYKHILDISVDFKDLEAVDPEFYKSLVWILENDITDVMELAFSMEFEEFGSHKVIDLIPDGRAIPVTEDNKKDYVRLITECKLTTAIKPQIDAFLRGFHEIIPASLISIFNEQELELLISGMPDIDVDDWRNNTEYSGFTISSPTIHWFWRAVRSFDQEYRAKLLQFVTGTSKVPLDGFASLQGGSGVQRFQIHRDYGSNTRLPSAHTCFNQLDLPEYESYEQLREMLIKAINECNTGFGLA